MNVYLLGIGGIGMSALARYFYHAGNFVAGYDLTPSVLTRTLESEGMAIHYQDSIQSIPQPVLQNKKDTLVIYTPALPHNHSEFLYLQKEGYQIIKRSVALGHIAKNHNTLAVSGTHGKTTTSTLLAHILTQSSEGCTAFLGGISKNYHSNLLLSHNDALVAEADEFDRSFLQLFPQEALITAADADHLDIYGTHQAVKEAFCQFAAQVTPGGYVVLKEGVDLDLTLQNQVTLYRYSYNTPCDFYASDISLEEGGMYTFTLHHRGAIIPNCRLGVPGKMNVENAVGAAALALLYGITPQAVKEALATFQGVERRMDVHYKSANCCYIDDYAHHPAELRAAITSVREWYPHRRLTGIFQPHLYSRTKDFSAEFAESLSLLDRVILLPIYPARELPLPGVTSQLILDQITINDKCIMEPSQVTSLIANEPQGVWLTLGAGNIDRLVPSITEILNQKGA